jgi:hypothetical protein
MPGCLIFPSSFRVLIPLQLHDLKINSFIIMHELAFTDGNRNQKPWPHGVQLRERDPGEVDWDSMEGGERRGGEEERKMETRNEEFTSCRCGEEHLVDLRWQEEGG